MAVKYSKTHLQSPEQTAAQMVRLSQVYKNDLGDKARWDLPRFFKYVADLPYRKDPRAIESLSRPALSMRENWPWRDCDDKSILLGAWCAFNGIPFRFIASSNRPDKNLHHVFLQAQFKEPIFLDATYKKNILGEVPQHTFLKPLTHWIKPMASIQVLEGQQMGWNPFKNIKRKTKNLTRQTKNIAKKTGKIAMKPVKAISKGMSKLMPSSIKKAIEKAVRSVVGNRKLSTAAKAAIIGPATAAALAIPGAQPFAPAVPVLVNEILDKIIKEHSGKSPSTPEKTLTVAEKKAAAIASAKEKASKLKVKKISKSADTTKTEMPTEQNQIPWLKIGLGTAAVGTVALLLKSKK